MLSKNKKFGQFLTFKNQKLGKKGEKKKKKRPAGRIWYSMVCTLVRPAGQRLCFEIERRLTFECVAAGVDAEGDRDEEGEDLFGGARRPLHQPRYVEQRIENQEEGRPQAHAAVERVEIQPEIRANNVNHYKKKKK